MTPLSLAMRGCTTCATSTGCIRVNRNRPSKAGNRGEDATVRDEPQKMVTESYTGGH